MEIRVRGNEDYRMSRKGPTFVVTLTCDGCEFQFVRPDGRRYCDAQDGRRMDHNGVSPECPHLATVLQSAANYESTRFKG